MLVVSYCRDTPVWNILFHHSKKDSRFLRDPRIHHNKTTRLRDGLF